jgi:hypothetical protein
MGAGGSGGLANVCLDLAGATATNDEEQRMMGDVERLVLTPGGPLLTRFANYQDCQTLIGAAISNASPENVSAAWNAALPNVQFQAELYDFALIVAERFQAIVSYTLSHGGGKSLAQQQLTLKAFVEIYDCILRFDEILTRLPRLLGDLSFFRRNAARHSDCEALFAKSNEMSMFFAVPSPLLTKVIGGVNATIKQPQDSQKVLGVFASIADFITATQLRYKPTGEDANLRQYREVAGALLCFDQIAPGGCFHAKAGVHTINAVTMLSQALPKPVALLNLLKYGSKHYKDPTTLKGITAILG